MDKFVRALSINRQAAKSPDRLVQIAEDNYSAYINETAEIIASNGSKPVILLSGPSGAGKTTTALRIERRLREQGLSVHTLSMDNYFLPITPETERELPRDENGRLDLESPYRLDIPLFNEHLKLLAEGEEFQMPIFDFATQSRPRTIPFRRHKHEIIIIEGIHALNPLVTGNTDRFAMCMYVSVRTRLKSEDGSLMHPRHVRLMRRLCRDRLFRKRDFRDIFSMFESVSRGEELYIFPFKDRADLEVDTFMAYEASVYKSFIESGLEAQSLDEFPECGEITKFLGELDAIDSGYVPPASLIREFIGGSELNY